MAVLGISNNNVARCVYVRCKCGVSALVHTKDLSDDEVARLVALATHDRIVDVHSVPRNELPFVNIHLHIDNAVKVAEVRRMIRQRKTIKIKQK